MSSHQTEAPTSQQAKGKTRDFFLMAAIAYWILQEMIIASQGEGSLLKKAIRGDWKGKLSPLLYTVAVLTAFWSSGVSQAIYVLVALFWLIPDRRIERALSTGE